MDGGSQAVSTPQPLWKLPACLSAGHFSWCIVSSPRLAQSAAPSRLADYQTVTVSVWIQGSRGTQSFCIEGVSAVTASRGSFENHCRDASLIILSDLEQNLCRHFSCRDVEVSLQVTGSSTCSVRLFGLFVSRDVWSCRDLLTDMHAAAQPSYSSRNIRVLNSNSADVLTSCSLRRLLRK